MICHLSDSVQETNQDDEYDLDAEENFQNFGQAQSQKHSDDQYTQSRQRNINKSSKTFRGYQDLNTIDHSRKLAQGNLMSFGRIAPQSNMLQRESLDVAKQGSMDQQNDRYRLMSAKVNNNYRSQQFNNFKAYKKDDVSPFLMSNKVQMLQRQSTQHLNQQHSTSMGMQKTSYNSNSTKNLIHDKLQLRMKKSLRRPTLNLFERDQLNEEVLQLKDQLNELKEHVLVLKNQRQFLQTELGKKDKQIEELNNALYQGQPQYQKQLSSSNLNNILGGGNSGSLSAGVKLQKSQINISPNLVMNLKRNMSDLQAQLQEKDFELDKLKKKMKFTKIQELEIELQEKDRLMSEMQEQYKMYQMQLQQQIQSLQNQSQQQQHKHKGSINLQIPNAQVSPNDNKQDQEINGLNDMITQLRDQLAQSDRKLQNKTLECQNVKKMHQELQVNSNRLIENLQSQHQQLKQQLEESQNQQKEQQNALKQKANPKPQPQIQQQPQISEIQIQQIKQLTNENQKLVKENSDVTEEVQNLKIQLEELQKQHQEELLRFEEKLNKSQTKHKAQIQDLKSQLKQYKQEAKDEIISDLHEKNNALENQVHDAKSNLEDVKKSKYKLEIENKDLQERLKALRDKIRILEQENNKRVSEISLKKAEINALRLQAEVKSEQVSEVDSPTKDKKQRESVKSVSFKGIDEEERLKRRQTMEAKRKRRGTAFNKQIFPDEEDQETAAKSLIQTQIDQQMESQNNQKMSEEENSSSSQSEEEKVEVKQLPKEKSRSKDFATNNRKTMSNAPTRTMSLLDALQEEESKIRDRESMKAPRQIIDEEDEEDFKENANKQLAEEGILKIGFYLNKNGYDIRDIFADIIFDESIDGKEFELISIRDFGELVKPMMGLNDKHVQSISILLSDHFIGEAFNFKFLVEIFIQMGLIKDESKLDNKTVRILNRIRAYQDQNKIVSVQEFLKGKTFLQTIRVKGRPDKQLELISSQEFFKLLMNKGLKKSEKIHENLVINFGIHPKLKDNIVVEKLQKHIGNIQSNDKLRKIGTMKRGRTYDYDQASLLDQNQESNQLQILQDVKNQRRASAMPKPRENLSSIQSDKEDDEELFFKNNQENQQSIIPIESSQTVEQKNQVQIAELQSTQTKEVKIYANQQDEQIQLSLNQINQQEYHESFVEDKVNDEFLDDKSTPLQTLSDKKDDSFKESVIDEDYEI
eukprot:403358941